MRRFYGANSTKLFHKVSERHLLAFSPTQTTKQSGPLPEHEYQVRLGAAIRVLRETLPQFMERGLVDRMDVNPSNPFMQVLKCGIPKSPAQPEHVYHSQIQFTFRPGPEPAAPLRLMSFKRNTDDPSAWTPSISLHGRRTYLFSASALRHALHACFAEPEILLENMSFLRRPATMRTNEALPNPGDELLTRIRFTGVNRLANTQQSYTIVSSYRFDRATGTICEHRVDKMMPLPGQRTWQTMVNVGSS